MKYELELFTGERALFAEDGAQIYDCIFDDGESPLKESKNIEVYKSQFKYKYPLWYPLMSRWKTAIGLRWLVRECGTPIIFM